MITVGDSKSLARAESSQAPTKELILTTIGSAACILYFICRVYP